MMLTQIPPHSPEAEARRPEDAKVRAVRRIRRVREELAEALAKFDAVLNVELQDGEINVGEPQTGEAQPGKTQRPEIQFGELDKIAADVTRAARRLEYRTGVSTGRESHRERVRRTMRRTRLHRLCARCKGEVEDFIEPADLQDKYTRAEERMLDHLYGKRTCAIKRARQVPTSREEVYFLLGRLSANIHLDVVQWSPNNTSSDFWFRMLGGSHRGLKGGARVGFKASDTLYDRHEWWGKSAPFDLLVCWKCDLPYEELVEIDTAIVAFDEFGLPPPSATRLA